MKKIFVLILASLLIVTLVSGCSSDKDEQTSTPSDTETKASDTETTAPETGITTPENAQDGTYKAEGVADNHGWKGFVELEIKDKAITSVNFDYDNEGKLKSEDAEYKAAMESIGTTPDVFLPNYETQLIEKQDVSAVDTIAGATTSFNDFNTLVRDALAKAE